MREMTCVQIIEGPLAKSGQVVGHVACKNARNTIALHVYVTTLVSLAFHASTRSPFTFHSGKSVLIAFLRLGLGVALDLKHLQGEYQHVSSLDELAAVTVAVSKLGRDVELPSVPFAH